MTAAPMVAGLPPDLTLSSGYILRLVALDATTGAAVSGVTLSDVSFFVTDLLSGGATGPDDTPLPLLVPYTDTP